LGWSFEEVFSSGDWGKNWGYLQGSWELDIQWGYGGDR
jgi:hypothetical protein